MTRSASCWLAGRRHTGQQHGVLVCRLPDVVRLAGQRRLVDLQVVALDQDSVGGEEITCSDREVQLVDLRDPLAYGRGIKRCGGVGRVAGPPSVHVPVRARVCQATN